jgi:hypothetical protein
VHTTCKMHGNCKECTVFHKGKPYCKSNAIRKAGLRIIFKVYDAATGEKSKQQGEK